MIGVFDSGVGGLVAYKELRRLLPKSDLLYLADRKNAPYGTKTKDELIRLVSCDVKRLRDMGAEEILVACCTASTVVPYLNEDVRCGVLPIIYPTAKAAARLKRITVIATEHTARSSAFGNEIRKISPNSDVQEIPCQRLVALVEGGARDENLTKECRRELECVRYAVKTHGSEGIILGCTHFSHLENTIKKLLPGVEVISPAKIGARELAIRAAYVTGSGKTIYTE